MPEETPSKPATRGPKPRPRAGILRKTKEEREQFAREEAERQKARAAENASSRGVSRGGRASRGGRGAAASGPKDDRNKDALGGGGGVFGAGSGVKPPTTRTKGSGEGYTEVLEGFSGPGIDGTLHPSSRGGGESAGGSRAAAGHKTDTFEIPSDDEADAPKRDIERIWLSSDEDDEVVMTSRKGKQKATQRIPKAALGLRPVRAPRTAREEEEKATPAGMRKKERGAAGRRSDAEEQHDLDNAHDRDEDAMDLDEPPAQASQDPPSSPELRRRMLRKLAGKPGREIRATATDTLEERAERLRVAEDAGKLREAFAPDGLDRHKATIDVDEGAGGVDDDKTIANLEDGTLILFQLPPLTPFLVDPAASPDEPEVKLEAGAEKDDRAAVPPPPPPLPTATATAEGDVDAKPEADGDAATAAKATLQLDGLLTAAEPLRLPPGRVGKLRLHRSGKVSLDWGGTDMEVRYGSEVDFLQDVVLVESPVKKEEARDDEGGDVDVVKGPNARDGDGDGEEDKTTTAPAMMGTTYALGQVRRKMVLIPDWAKLYD